MDGELRRTTSGLYKGTLHTLNTIYRHEGLRGLQAGLAIAVFREGTKNIFRLGFYSPILSFVHDTKDGSVAPIYKRLFAGGTFLPSYLTTPSHKWSHSGAHLQPSRIS